MENGFLANTPFWIILFTLGAILLFGVETFSVLFTYIYQNFLYPKIKKPRFDPSYLPRCSIIIPTKGISRNFEANIRAFLEQDYPDYEVIYSVEDESDPGTPVIRSMIQDRPRAQLVVAGYAVTCCQKNQNMLAGLEVVRNPTVLVFAESGICPDPMWLRSLILPLSDPAISVTTGYRWLCGMNGSFGEHLHTLTNLTIYSHMYLSSFFFGGVAWAGSMAIRQNVFEELKIKQRWAETFSDDMSLVKALGDHGKKSMMVPECVLPADDILVTARGSIDWFCRQLLNFKAFFFSLWRTGGAIISGSVLTYYLLLPAALLGAFLSQGSFWDWGGGPALVFYFSEVLTALLYGLLGPTRRHWLFVLRIPLLRMAMLISCFKTIGTYELTWAGIKYCFNRQGQVQKIIR